MHQERNQYEIAFAQFGVQLEERGDQLVGMCPFEEKKDKFFVNPENGMWDSKVAGKAGNLYTFFRDWSTHCTAKMKAVDFMPLAESRKLPVAALLDHVIPNALNSEYMIPCYNVDGKLSDLGHYSVGSKGVMRTKGTKMCLNGAHKLADTPLNVPVYICEGEWDWIALQWMHAALKAPSVCVCLPGAGTFKEEWVPLFKGRAVRCCYDNDEAGRKGEEKAQALLTGVAKEVKYLQWLELHPDKYDVRDLILDIAHPSAVAPKLKKCYETMEAMFQLSSRTPQTAKTPAAKAADAGEVTPPEQVPTRAQVETKYGEWLKMTDTDPLAFMFGVCYANRFQGDPVWGLLVAPPGGSKTELLITLATSAWVEMVSTLTPASLVSGMRMPSGEDPSILPKLNKRMLIVKDFTTILTSNVIQRDEVFAILRDVYDGRFEKMFGNGLKREYEVKFGMLAGVTPSIDGFQSVHTSLGERFLKYRLDQFLLPGTEEDRLLRVLSNINHENSMREELAAMGKRMLGMFVDPAKAPKFTPEIGKSVMRCARYTAKLRSAVERDKYTGALTAIPTTEVATRLTKQLMKLAMGVAIYYGHDKIGDDEMRIVRKVCIDTAPAMQQHATNAVLRIWRKTKSPVSIEDILPHVPFCAATLAEVVRDLCTLGILEKLKEEARLNKFTYRPTPVLLEIAEGAGV